MIFGMKAIYTPSPASDSRRFQTFSFSILMVLTMVLRLDFGCLWTSIGAADAPRINGLQVCGNLTRKRSLVRIQS